METREAIAAAADIARVTAFVEANRATACRRCTTKGVLDKRGLCIDCSEKRLATMRVPDAERNASSRETAPQPATTIYSLLGGGGVPIVQGADLNHCNSAVSARANLAQVVKDIGQQERHLIVYPNSQSAWDAYVRQYDRIEGYVRDIKHHEAAVRANHPDLKTQPIQIPQKLERATARDWLNA